MSKAKTLLILAREGNQSGRNFINNNIIHPFKRFTAMENILDKIDAIKANSVTEKEFKSVWGISLDEHMNKMMAYVKDADARIAEERKNG